MAKQRAVWGLATILATTAVAEAAGAAPIPCPGGICTVSDGAATMATATDGSLVELSVNGIDQLASQRLFATYGGANSPANPLTDTPITDFSGILSRTQDEDTNQIVIVFSNSGVTVTVTYTLTGGQNMATVDYTIVNMVTDLSNGYTLLDFVDFDLMEFFDGDTVAFVMPNTAVQTGKGATATARAFSPFNYFDVGPCCSAAMIARDVDGHLANGAGPVGPGDESAGFQYNVTTPSGQSSTISSQLQVTVPELVAPAPALSPFGGACALVVLTGLGALALRRQTRGAGASPAGAPNAP